MCCFVVLVLIVFVVTFGFVFNSVGVHISLCLLCAVLGLDFVVLVSVLVCC